MKPSAPNHQPDPIRGDVVYTLPHAARLLNWGRRAMQQAQRDGLRTVLYGRNKYVRGQAILDFFEMLEGRDDA